MFKKTRNNRGLIIVYTGSGKGKTTASLGLALRAAGHNLKVLIIQFLKGSWPSGEVRSLKKLFPQIEIKPAGKGFVKILNDKKPFQQHVQAAQAAFALAKESLKSKKYQVIILDEINYALKGNLIQEKDVLNLIREKPPLVHLVLTGNFASKKIIKKADLVTEMKEIKHPFLKGVKAKIGIDY